MGVAEDAEKDDPVTGYVDARGGADPIELSGGAWAGYYGGVPHADCSDPVACDNPLGTGGGNPFADGKTRVYGGTGADSFTLAGGADIAGDVLGDNDDEVFTLLSGRINGDLDAGGGNDTIILSGNVIMNTGTISGGAGTDTLNYAGGRILEEDRTTERTEEAVGDGDGLFQNFNNCTGEFPADGSPPVTTGTTACNDDGGNAPSVRDSVRSAGEEFAFAVAPPEEALDSDAPVDVPDASLSCSASASACAPAASLQGFERVSFSPALALAGVLPSALQDFTSAAASFLVAPQDSAPQGGLWVKESETLAFGGGGMTLAAQGLEGFEAEGSYGARMALTQQGYDKPLARSVVLRSFMHLAKGEIAATGDAGGHAEVQGYGAGFALLWGSGDAYMQATALAARYEADVRREGDASSASGEGFLVSMDAGRAYALRGGLTLRPQVRALWQSLFLDDFTQGGNRLVFGADERFETRAGAALEREGLEATAFLVRTDADAASLTTGLRQNYHPDGFALELGLNASLSDSLGVSLTRRLSLEGRRDDFAASFKFSRNF